MDASGLHKRVLGIQIAGNIGALEARSDTFILIITSFLESKMGPIENRDRLWECYSEPRDPLELFPPHSYTEAPRRD